MNYDEQEQLIDDIFEAKFGKFSTIDISSFWNVHKEEKYKEYIKNTKYKNINFIDILGIKYSRNIFQKKSKNCILCGKHNYRLVDMTSYDKYRTCSTCYVQYIEDREERWKNGWRPNK